MERSPETHPSSAAVRKGQGDVKLSREEFAGRLAERFYDPAFDVVRAEIDRIIEIAWRNYDQYHKDPRKRKAGPGFADPEFELPLEWLAARDAVIAAEQRQRDPSGPRRILLVCGAARHDETCPGEMSKTFRLVQLAREIVEASEGFEADLLDLSHLTAQYGRQILPCKACVSTAMPLCHWPCSCYPNHAMGQVNDWMNELYPRWVAAHGLLIVSPVYWFQAPSVLKLMIDRLVCADGGNPDPTTTHGKKPEEAKALELAGWGYPKHLAGRAFGIIVHGDAEGAETAASQSHRLAPRHGSGTSRHQRHPGPLHRLLRTVCHQPRRAGPGCGASRRGAERGSQPGEHRAPDSQQPVRASG